MSYFETAGGCLASSSRSKKVYKGSGVRNTMAKFSLTLQSHKENNLFLKSETLGEDL
jgi:hypothetical protein